MAGQIFVPGNAYIDNAEFNWWFDPEATQIVLRAAVPHFIIPLDCTNHVPLTKEVYEQVAQHQPQTIVTMLYAQSYAPFFGSGPPPFPLYIWDTNALAYFVHPEFATDTQGIWIDIHNTFDANYGKSIPYPSNPFPSIDLLQQSTVIFAINTTAFYSFYVDLLTRPVPVKFVHPPPSRNLDD
jgi:inosine-uridine nucleoside N-ribohydrolase